MSNSSALDLLVMPPSLAWLADAGTRSSKRLAKALRDLGFAVVHELPSVSEDPAFFEEVDALLCVLRSPSPVNPVAAFSEAGVVTAQITLPDDNEPTALQIEAMGLKTCAVPMQNFDDDEELFALTLQAILAESPELLCQAMAAQQSSETHELRRLIHTLKGHTKLVGENTLAGALQALEDRAARGEHLSAEQEVLLKTNLDVLFSRLRLIARTV